MKVLATAFRGMKYAAWVTSALSWVTAILNATFGSDEWTYIISWGAGSIASALAVGFMAGEGVVRREIRHEETEKRLEAADIRRALA